MLKWGKIKKSNYARLYDQVQNQYIGIGSATLNVLSLQDDI